MAKAKAKPTVLKPGSPAATPPDGGWPTVAEIPVAIETGAAVEEAPALNVYEQRYADKLKARGITT